MGVRSGEISPGSGLVLGHTLGTTVDRTCDNLRGDERLSPQEEDRLDTTAGFLSEGEVVPSKGDSVPTKRPFQHPQPQVCKGGPTAPWSLFELTPQTLVEHLLLQITF